MIVAILGASPKKNRYANKAQALLAFYGHQVFPIHPMHQEIDGLAVYPTLAHCPDFHTLTIYMNPERQKSIYQQILDSPAQRVIFNPGTENDALANQLRENGKEVWEKCTLVMLDGGMF